MSDVTTWIDAGNTSWPLDGSGDYMAIWDTSNGRQGIYAPPIQIITQEVPLQPGSRLRQVKTTERPIVIPVMIRASSESALAVARRALRFAMNPRRGPGILQIAAADGSTRQMTCYQETGFEGDESDQYRGPGFALLPLGFKALDPYWYDVNNTTVVYTSFGVSVGVFNGGDVDTWPFWTIVGPATNPMLVNNTTGKAITLTGVIASGHSLEIDTRPFSANAKTILDVPPFGPGTLHYDYLSPTSQLWPLVQGNNSITITMSGTTGATSVTLQYKQAYDGY